MAGKGFMVDKVPFAWPPRDNRRENCRAVEQGKLRAPGRLAGGDYRAGGTGLEARDPDGRAIRSWT